MPAPARISVPVQQPTPVKSTANATLKTPSSIPRTKARMVHRRRARGRLGDTESDDELMREPHSDSDFESTTSTLDSESVSESENENEAKPEARVPSPSQTPLGVAAATSSPPSHLSPNPTFFPPSHDWSDMVAEENANGAAALPVIDFADMSSHVEATSPPSQSVRSPSPAIQEQSRESRDSGMASSSTGPRKPAQTARQAYLARLDSDPAYVPTLGQFWSHDDRLLDKELRSLSGWWRGRWQGRGRGARGRGGWGTRGRGNFTGGWGQRGRGGFVNGGSSRPEDVPQENTPPVDRSWKHDGFEELKQDDDTKRPPLPFHARGGFPRGRGGNRGNFPSRGSFAPRNRSSSPQEPQARPQSEFRQSSTSDLLRFGDGTRPWFAMKPERVWTKQFDGYLYFESQLKPIHSQGIGQGVRIKLPGMKCMNSGSEALRNDAIVVRLPQWDSITPWTVSSSSQEPFAERAIIVKLPPRNVSGKQPEVQAPEDVITVASPPMDDDPLPLLWSEPTPSYQTHPTQETHTPSLPVGHLPSHTSDVVSNSQPSGSAAAPSDLPPEAPLTQETVHNEAYVTYNVTSAGPSQPHVNVRPQDADNPGTASPQLPRPSVLPALQAVAPFQPSPSYGSPYPYGVSGISLPPGIAVSEDGVTYEISTGRTVYLHTPPPPPPPPPMQIPMYNPRPMPMPHTHHGSVHFLPHHAHGHASSMSMSVSPPSFLSSPPMFTLPRQSSRLEIRAPGEEKGKEREDTENVSTQVRQARSRLAANVNAEPFTPASHVMGYYSTEAQQQAFDNAQRHHQHQQAMYHPPPYYYPVNADGSTPYGYGQQYASVDAGQSQQYDTYGQEVYPQQHAAYY